MADPILPPRAFYLIRHGQTDANVAHIISGGTESDLTEEGRQKAAALGDVLDRINPLPARIVHSGRRRTRDTAAALNKKLNLPVTVDPMLDEHNFGSWIDHPSGDALDHIMRGEAPPGGETLVESSLRIQRALTALLNSDSSLPLVVGHGGTFRAMSYLYGGTRRHTLNCQLHYFEPANGPFPWQVWSFTPMAESLRRDEVFFERGGNTTCLISRVKLPSSPARPAALGRA